ncbi:MAG: DNA gyrase C-terminal beta-propeller domain-containing protein, partial [Staphylococcus simulans]|nr:DNA gyrase C-terminal beta-propeller domain-containing protein [Staphylococcus simulans]
IRFKESLLRPLGRTAAGVKGITLREGDEVIGLAVANGDSEDEVLVVTENGYGKRTPLEEYRVSNRGGKGIKTATITEKNGDIVCITTVTGEEDLMIVTNHGVIIRIDVGDISQNGRSAQGVRLIRLSDEQFVSTVAKVQEEPEDELEGTSEDETEPGENGPTPTINEQVVESEDDDRTIHTEELDETVEEDGERTELRQDFMDRVNEDIENADSEDEDNEEE